MANSTRRLGASSVQPNVALGGEVVHEPGLPFPWVTYPGHYGAFHTFAAAPDGPWWFCSCAQPALINAIILWRAGLQGTGQPAGREWHVLGTPELNVPREAYWRRPEDPALYAESACHRCNLVTPTLRWSHEMYETQFRQYHGWYVEQARFRAGFPKYGTGHIPDAEPELTALQQRVHRVPVDQNGRHIDGWPPDPVPLLPGVAQPQQIEPGPVPSKEDRTRWRRMFENEARTEFGYRKVGEGFVAETQLAHLLARLFPSETIVRHHRPAWLGGLELDIWLPARRLGVEYQGQQHYKAVKAWGGEPALAALQERDATKRRLCAENDVALIEALRFSA